jgi:hypothetical protein
MKVAYHAWFVPKIMITQVDLKNNYVALKLSHVLYCQFVQLLSINEELSPST